MKPPAVLLVDPDRDSESIVGPLVAGHGLALQIAESGGEALSCAAEREYEAILISGPATLDALPGVLTRLARLRPRTPLMVRVHSERHGVTRAPAGSSLFAVLRGPIEPKSFGPCLDAALEARRTQRSDPRGAPRSFSPAPIEGRPKEMSMYTPSNQQLAERPESARPPVVGLAPSYAERGPVGHTDPLEILTLVAERGVPLRDLQDRYIDAVLSMTAGNKVRAARILGIDRKTLYRRAERRTRRDNAS